VTRTGFKMRASLHLFIFRLVALAQCWVQSRQRFDESRQRRTGSGMYTQNGHFRALPYRGNGRLKSIFS